MRHFEFLEDEETVKFLKGVKTIVLEPLCVGFSFGFVYLGVFHLLKSKLCTA
jgi:hypothetical protein